MLHQARSNAHVTQKHLVKTCEDYGRLCKLKTNLSNDTKGSYKPDAGELVGTARLVVCWTAIGHPVCLFRQHECSV